MDKGMSQEGYKDKGPAAHQSLPRYGMLTTWEVPSYADHQRLEALNKIGNWFQFPTKALRDQAIKVLKLKEGPPTEPYGYGLLIIDDHTFWIIGSPGDSGTDELGNTLDEAGLEDRLDSLWEEANPSAYERLESYPPAIPPTDQYWLPRYNYLIQAEAILSGIQDSITHLGETITRLSDPEHLMYHEAADYLEDEMEGQPLPETNEEATRIVLAQLIPTLEALKTNPALLFTRFEIAQKLATLAGDPWVELPSAKELFHPESN